MCNREGCRTPRRENSGNSKPAPLMTSWPAASGHFWADAYTKLSLSPRRLPSPGHIMNSNCDYLCQANESLQCVARAGAIFHRLRLVSLESTCSARFL